MNIAQRFTLMVKGNLNAVFDQLEDPERSLHQLILDMEEQLESAKRAAAAAMANEDRLRERIAFQESEIEQWKTSARRALKQGNEGDARSALRKSAEAESLAARLRERLDAQTRDTAEVRESLTRLHERLGDARNRLQITQARMRQSEARKAAGSVMRGVERANLYAEFDRLEQRVERQASEDRAYIALDDALNGHDLRRRCENAAIDEQVEDQLHDLRQQLDGSTDGAGDGQRREA